MYILFPLAINHKGSFPHPIFVSLYLMWQTFKTWISHKYMPIILYYVVFSTNNFCTLPIRIMFFLFYFFFYISIPIVAYLNVNVDRIQKRPLDLIFCSFLSRNAVKFLSLVGGNKTFATNACVWLCCTVL